MRRGASLADDAPLRLQSEGQRMLLHVTGTLAAIANECEARSKQSVLDWRNGKRKPSVEARARIYAAFNIPPAAWDTPPGIVPYDKPPPAAYDANAAPDAATTLQEVLALLAVVRRDRMNAAVTLAERVRLTGAETQLLKLRAELESKAELSEDRYVREHPSWLKAKREIARVLVAYPEAARAVVDVLTKLDL